MHCSYTAYFTLGYTMLEQDIFVCLLYVADVQFIIIKLLRRVFMCTNTAIFSY